MKTQELSEKIVYGHLDHLKKYAKGGLSFSFIAIDDNYYSDIGFIEYFKDCGISFWFNVIFKSMISMECLFEQFKTYMMDKELSRDLFDLYEFPRQKYFHQIFFDKKYNANQRLEEYVNEYNKIIKKNNI